MPDSKEIAKALAPELASELDKRRTVDEKTHAQHHEFIAHLLVKYSRREKLWQAIKVAVATTGITGLMYGAGHILVYIWEHIRWGGTNG